MIAIQKIRLSVVSDFGVGVWDDLEKCEISRPDILSQLSPEYNVQNNTIYLKTTFVRMGCGVEVDHGEG